MSDSTDEEEECNDDEYTDPDESGLRSGKGPALLSRLFGKF